MDNKNTNNKRLILILLTLPSVENLEDYKLLLTLS